MAVVAVSCARPEEPWDEAARLKVAAEVRTAVDAFADAERRLDTETVIGFLAPDFYMYGDGVRADYESVVEGMRSTLPTLQRFETTWSDIEVNVLGPDDAFVTMIFQDAITDAEGVTRRARGPNTFVWKRIEGSWRIRYVDADHYPDPGP